MPRTTNAMFQHKPINLNIKKDARCLTSVRYHFSIKGKTTSPTLLGPTCTREDTAEGRGFLGMDKRMILVCSSWFLIVCPILKQWCAQCERVAITHVPHPKWGLPTP